jgi:hypothetical protein
MENTFINQNILINLFKLFDCFKNDSFPLDITPFIFYISFFNVKRSINTFIICIFLIFGADFIFKSKFKFKFVKDDF